MRSIFAPRPLKYNYANLMLCVYIVLMNWTVTLKLHVQLFTDQKCKKIKIEKLNTVETK